MTPIAMRFFRKSGLGCFLIVMAAAQAPFVAAAQDAKPPAAGGGREG